MREEDEGPSRTVVTSDHESVPQAVARALRYYNRVLFKLMPNGERTGNPLYFCTSTGMKGNAILSKESGWALIAVWR